MFRKERGVLCMKFGVRCSATTHQIPIIIHEFQYSSIIIGIRDVLTKIWDGWIFVSGDVLASGDRRGEVKMTLG